ncbi:MAG: hypothetical protein M0P69_20590 [Bacteroidales bacterium]|nr:hypothetical protein [Bacteroidales bacterium]
MRDGFLVFLFCVVGYALGGVIGSLYQIQTIKSEIVTLSSRVTAVEDSVCRIRPLQASHNALARRVHRIDRQAGRTFSTKPVKEER